MFNSVLILNVLQDALYVLLAVDKVGLAVDVDAAVYILPCFLIPKKDDRQGDVQVVCDAGKGTDILCSNEFVDILWAYTHRLCKLGFTDASLFEEIIGVVLKVGLLVLG